MVNIYDEAYSTNFEEHYYNKRHKTPVNSRNRAVANTRYVCVVHMSVISAP